MTSGDGLYCVIKFLTMSELIQTNSLIWDTLSIDDDDLLSRFFAPID